MVNDGKKLKSPKLNKDQIKKIAKELFRTKTLEDFAEEYKCSKFTISGTKKKLQDAGIKFPEPKNAITDAIEDLRKSDPELFKAFNVAKK